MTDFLSDLKAELRDLMRRIGVLESASPLGWSSISEGALEIRSAEGLIVVGTSRIDGTQYVDGRLEGSGNFVWTGPWRFTGTGTVTGNVTWSGDFNLTGDMIVAGSGRILVGDMVIDPSGGGSIAFPGGASVQADPGGGVRMIQGTSRVYVGSGLVSMQLGSRSVVISASGIQMNGLDTIPSSLANGAPAGCIWSDGSGEIFRVVPD